MPPTYLNRTNHLMHDICRFSFICGSINFWHKDLDLPSSFMKFNRIFMIVVRVIMALVQISTCASFWHDLELSEKQRSDRLVFLFGHFQFGIVITWAICFCKTTRDIHRRLTEDFLAKYLDIKLETIVLAKLKLNWALVGIASLGIIIAYAFQGLKYAYESGTGFTFPITHWPSLHDRCAIAYIARFIIFLSWAIFITQITGAHVIVITTTICMSFQFKNLQSYFRSLNGIFEEAMGQDEKNDKYLKEFIEGIKLHEKAIQCTKDVQRVFNAMYSGQVILNTTTITLLLLQITTMERTLAAVVAITASSFICLMVTGIFMCHAGDITIEASGIAQAMYDSGWHHVRGRAATKNVAVLLTVAIALAQLVKLAYSIFSVII